MTKLPAGSSRDTAELAKRYSETSQWQREQGLSLLEIAKPSASQTVLDLGCGTGELSAELARRVGRSGRGIAIDPDAARLEHARERLPTGLVNLTLEQASGEDLHRVAPFHAHLHGPAVLVRLA
jgi:ubiquinone/menaquinone biosynthesis C-methylase UbiE